MKAYPKAGNERRRGATDDPELRRLFRGDGQIAAIPATQEMRLRLRPLYADYATLRRDLIDAKLLTRERGAYRRA